MQESRPIANQENQARQQRNAAIEEQQRVVRGIISAVFVSLPVWLTVGSLTLIILR